MTLQIDIKKPDEGCTSMAVNLYINGECFQLHASHNTVQDLLHAGVVKETKRHLRNEETNKIEEFDYPEGCDGMGVKYTSKAYNCWSHE